MARGCKRTLFGRSLLVGCLAALLCGCVDTSFLVPREPVTIRFAFPGDTNYYAALIEAFQSQHKNVTLELAQGNRFYFRRQSEENQYDVALVPQFMLPGLIEEQAVISLNALISEDRDFSMDDFYPGAADVMNVQGQTYAIPYMVDVAVMVYNKDLFDKYVVPYPELEWTQDEFLERAKRLTHEDAGEYGYAYQQVGGQRGLTELMLLIYQNGGRFFDDLSNPTRIIFNEPLNVEAMQWYADLSHLHKVAPPLGGRQMPYPDAGINGGKYAMWIGYLGDDWGDLNVGIAPLPRGRNAVTTGTVLGLVISPETQDAQAAWEWVSYISGQAPPGLMPPRRSVAESDAMTRLLSPEGVDVGRASLPNLISFNLSFEGQLGKTWGTAMQAYSTAVARIQNGDPVQTTLDEAQEKSGF
ncbi:MAG: sugar ABC transporter substrate-binding protein [Anaerolineae bacterium]|nr:sugar ABC transporter substrate-binding protein [Anaerolineae bacterium]